MILPKTPEMERIWSEIEQYLCFSNEKGYEVIEGSPEGTSEKLEEYRRLRKEQWDFAESLNS
ncbi:hypothetical protein DWW50_12885 [Eubacterium sp. AF15-50]|uniref:hypothetical protein n=1 Tax=unclassified Eubacterium (in: firmicutes) TaxID=2624479 RepID=UPI000E51BFA9|nr:MULTISPECIES: hypothetical protein [unclassified Eubacterium (in: firmicutes)]RHR72623.1 hypothetical protein DWW68_06460 [Eubacterium sp. AF16-48]RHR75695.1 hypothetical protein DWW50_12885 [Eubacterium sp. AF15-50]